MTRRPPAVLFVLGAAALVVAGAWWLTDNPPPDDRTASAHEAAPPEPPFVTETEGTIAEHPPPSTVEPLPALDHDADDAVFSNQDLWAHISDPANSDLPSELFVELSQLGADIVRADATGQGRDRWPDYWAADDGHSGRAEPCCTAITIHAAGAFTHPGDPHAVQVTIIWTSNHPQGARADRVTQLRLVQDPAGWQPT